MNLLIVGATGMIGQSVLREALLDPAVARVVTLGRRGTRTRHPKLEEIVHADMWNLAPIESRLTGFDACIYCLGVSSFRMSEADYSRITYDLTMAIAAPLLRLNPGMSFVYISGAGADSTEAGRMMWARVKGRIENALLRMGFARAYMFRPGLIIPMHGIRSSTLAYNLVYGTIRPFVPFIRTMRPASITTTDQLGRAMVTVAREGYARPILEMNDIRRF